LVVCACASLMLPFGYCSITSITDASSVLPENRPFPPGSLAPEVGDFCLCDFCLFGCRWTGRLCPPALSGPEALRIRLEGKLRPAVSLVEPVLVVSVGQWSSEGFEQAKPGSPEQKDTIKNHHRSLNDLNAVMKIVDTKNNPTGTQNFPARTCRELFTQYKDKMSGSYFIDPNEGANIDEVLVYCNKETMETCVDSSTKIEKKNWGSMDDGYRWVAEELQGVREIEYTMKLPQMKILQFLSSHVKQNFTYHCKNSWAISDDSNREYSHPLRIRGDNYVEETLSVKTESRKLGYKILKDECANAKYGIWRKTIVEIRSKLPEQLPITDFAPHDIGGADEEFGIEIGPVCFS